MADRRRPTLVDEVREGLIEAITNGTYGVGDRLPNEQEIGERFTVSRATVREAYRQLIDAGYLNRRQGSGTYVSRAPLRHALDLNLSYTALIQAAGYTPSIEVLAHRVETVSRADARKLRLDAAAEVIVIERIRYADKQPVVYSVDWIPIHLVPAGLRGTPGPSVFDMLDESHHSPSAARAHLKPVLAEEPVSGYLQVPVGSPLLHIDQVDQDQSGTPVLTSYEWHTSDVFEMWINRTRRVQ